MGEGNKPIESTVFDLIEPIQTPIQTIAFNLYKGNRGNEVKILQQFLISENYGPAARELSRIGPTGYFGVYTRAALAEFQANVGISPAWGNFGPITRFYLSADYYPTFNSK